MSDVLDKLRGGDRRSIGRSDEISRAIITDCERFSQSVQAMMHRDPIIRMRAADAVEKATRKHPELLQPYKRKILRQVASIDQAEVRWHVAQMLPRLLLTAKEQDHAVSILFDYLDSKSSILRTFAMQALTDLALRDVRLRSRVSPLIEFLAGTGSAAMRSRGRKLLAVLQRQDGNKASGPKHV